MSVKYKATVLRVLLFVAANIHFGYGLITKVQCNTSDKGTCVEPFCFFSTNDTNGSAVIASYGCTDLTKPLTKINVHLKVYMKMSSQYYQIGYFPKVDYCQFITNIDKENFLYTGVRLLKKKMPEVVHECPYQDDQLQVNNVTLTDRDFKYIPAGRYKVVVTFSDDVDSKILKMTTHYHIS